MRVLLTLGAFLLSLAIVVALAIVLALFLVGPHADLLPAWLQPFVGVALWAAVLGLPIWIATRVWARLDRRREPAVPPRP